MSGPSRIVRTIPPRRHTGAMVAALLAAIPVLGGLGTLGPGARAATTGSVTLSGVVAITCNITVAPQAGYNTLDLTANVTNQTVALVTERCTDPRGYTVTLTTANGRNRGRLVGNTAGNNNAIRYTIGYDGTPVRLQNSLATITDVTTGTTAGGVVKGLSISYSGRTNLNVDTYTDTLTLTITGK